MSDKKKKLAQAIILSMGKSKPEPEEESPEEDSTEDEEPSSDEDSAAQEVIDAIQAGDASGLAEALKSFIAMC